MNKFFAKEALYKDAGLPNVAGLRQMAKVPNPNAVIMHHWRVEKRFMLNIQYTMSATLMPKEYVSLQLPAYKENNIRRHSCQSGVEVVL